jgi:4-amino-4-deoxy-L-arabinose transferase-like glycosyltransferase
MIIPRPVQRAASSLALIIVVALAIRVGYLWYRQSVTSHYVLSTISFLYEPGNIAYSLATGAGFSSPFRVPTGPTAWQAPIYPLLLSFIFRLFGTYTFAAFLAAVSFNILCSVLACIPIYAAGTRIAGRTVGLLAAWLWAIFPNAFVIPTDWIWDTCLSALLAATILWATLAVADSRRLRDWGGYGLLWGIALMTNPTLLSALPLYLGWMAFRAWKSQSNSTELKTICRRTILSLVIIVLCCVPWTVRNYRVFHSFIPYRSVLGLQLWLGNNDAYKDRFPGQLHPLDNAAERERYVAMGEVAYMREKQDLAIHWILSHLRREAELFEQRFVATWAGTSKPWKDFFSTDSIFIRFVFLANVSAAILGTAGIVILFLKRNPFAFPAAVLPVIFPFAFYFSQALLRYRHPIDPIVMILCAVSIAAALGRPEAVSPLGDQS